MMVSLFIFLLSTAVNYTSHSIGTLANAKKYLGVIMLFIFLSFLIPSYLRFLSRKYNLTFVVTSYINSILLSPSNKSDYLISSPQQSSKNIVMNSQKSQNNSSRKNNQVKENQIDEDDNSNNNQSDNMIQIISSHPSEVDLNTSQKYSGKLNESNNKILLVDFESEKK